MSKTTVLQQVKEFVRDFMPIKPTKSTRSILATLFLAILVTACEEPGDSSSTSGDTSVRDIFSHSSYTFAPNIDGDETIYSELFVGRVLPNIIKIKRIVAKQLEGNLGPNDLVEGSDYTITFDLANKIDSAATQFFRVNTEIVNGLSTGVISVVNPAGSYTGLTFDEIRDFLDENSLEVKIAINIISPDAKQQAKDLIEHRVSVEILNSDDSVDLTSTSNTHLRYSRPTGEANFTLIGGIEENQQASSSAAFGLPYSPNRLSSNPLSAWVISQVKTSASTAGQVTLFYDVRDSADINNACAAGGFYFDNNDGAIKSGNIFNYEADPNNPGESYLCRLAVSIDGITYRPLAFVVNNGDNLPTNGLPAPINQLDEVTQVSQSGVGNQRVCSTSHLCYYGDINLAVQNINEAPQVSISGGGINFVGTSEGVGPINDYARVVLSDSYYQGGPLSGKRIVESTRLIIIEDEDVTQTGTDEGLVFVAAVTPNHGSRAFAVERVNDNNRQNYQLVIDGSLLNYESFQPSELTNGQAIYKLSIGARDSEDNSITNRESFNFEVTDVKYPPVFVNPNNRNQAVAPSDAFVKDDSIITSTSGSPLYLPAGIGALEIGRIGQIKAVDSETGSAAKLEYRIANTASVAIRNNLNLVTTSNRFGRQLIISDFGLINGTRGNITLEVSLDKFEAVDGITSTSINLEVRDSVYANIASKFTNPSSANIRFNTDALSIPIAEKSLEDPPTIIDLSSSIVNTGSETPNFGFVPANQIPANFASDIFQLGFVSVADSLRKFSIQDGIVSLREGQSLEFPGLFLLPIFVNAGGSFVAAQNDIIILTIIVTDINVAPIARQNGRVIDSVDNKLTGSIDENQPPGTVISRFTITDDNQKFISPTVMLIGANNAATANLHRLLKLDVYNNSDGSVTAIISSATEFDFEDLTVRTVLENVPIRITDTGSYTHTNAAGRILSNPRVDGGNIARTNIGLTVTVRDLAESPKLIRGESSEYSISENADIGDNAASANGNQIIAHLVNAQDFFNPANNYNNSRIKYTLEGPFKDILTVTPNDDLDAEDAVELGLIVADAEALEDLGDGFIFPAIIVATDSVGGKSSQITINIKINNVDSNSEIDINILQNAVNEASLAINEQDVVGRSTYVFPLTKFSLPIDESLSKDANEFFPFRDSAGRLRRVSPNIDVIASVSNSAAFNPSSFLDSTNIIRLVETTVDGKVFYQMVITDTDFIDAALFGDIGIELRGKFSGGRLAPVTLNIDVSPASDKVVKYADTSRYPLTNPNPPIYAFNYTQNAYAASVSPTDNSAIIRAVDIPIRFDKVQGISQQYISIGEPSNIYETEALVGKRGRFIKRNGGSNNLQAINGNAAVANDGSITIRFDRGTGKLLDFNEFDVLRPDADGNLIKVNQAELTTYFDIQINNTQGTRYLKLSPKTFTISGATNAPSVNSQMNYAALDTIPLFLGATTNHTLNYFIRAKSVPTTPVRQDVQDQATLTTGASNYALAQFSVVISSAGSGNQPPEPPDPEPPQPPDPEPPQPPDPEPPQPPDPEPPEPPDPEAPDRISFTRFAPIPRLSVIASQNFNYADDLRIEWRIEATGDQPPPRLIIPSVVGTTDRCRLASSGTIGITSNPFSASTQIIPLKPGRCTVLLRAFVSSSISIDRAINFDFPELAPDVFVQSLYSSNLTDTAAISDISDPSISKIFAVDDGQPTNQGLDILSQNAPHQISTNGFFLIGIKASNRDPGDDGGALDVSFITANAGDCTITTATIAGYDSDNSFADGVASHLYKVTKASAGTCPAITVSALEDLSANTVVIPTSTLLFVGAPHIDAPQEFSGFIDYDTDITYQATVNDTNGDDGFSPTVRVTSINAGICSARIANSVPSSPTEQTLEIVVTPLTGGDCIVELSAQKNGFSGTPRRSRITLPPPPRIPPTLSVTYTKTNIPLGQDAVLTITATKQDPRPNPIVNTGSNTLVSFPRDILSTTPDTDDFESGFTSCLASIGEDEPEIVEREYSSDSQGATASVSYTVDSFQQGHCGNLTLTATEVGATGEITLDVFRVVAPSYFRSAQFVPSTDNLPTDFNYKLDLVNLNWVAEAVVDRFPLTRITLNSTTPEVCSLSQKITDSQLRLSRSDKVVPLKPGVCQVSLNASTSEPMGSSSSITANITFPEIAPNVFIQSLYIVTPGPLEDIDNSNINQLFQLEKFNRQTQGLQNVANVASYRLVAGEERFIIQINATTNDPGDDNLTDGEIDVTFSDTFVAGSCNITRLNITGALSDLSFDDDIAGQLYLVDNTAGPCPAITLSATEDGETTNVTIPANTFFFDRAPRLSIPQEVSGFTDYNTPIIYRTTVTDTDGDDGSVPEVLVTEVDANICSTTATRPELLGGTSGLVEIQITPHNLGQCSLEVTVTENGLNGAPQSINIILSATGETTAPLVTTNLNNDFSALVGRDVNLAVTATKRDADTTALVTFPLNITSGGFSISNNREEACVARLNDLEDAERNYPTNAIGEEVTVNYTITSPNDIGSCRGFLFSATEDNLTGYTSPITINFISHIRSTDAVISELNNNAADNFDYSTSTFNVSSTVHLASEFADDLASGKASLPLITHRSTTPEICTIDSRINSPSEFIADSLTISNQVLPHQSGRCDLLLNITIDPQSDDSRVYVRQINFDLPELPPAIFVQALYSTNLSSVEDIDDENLNVIFNTQALTPENQGLNLLSGIAPARTDFFGAFYIGINASNRDSFGGANFDRIDITIDTSENNCFASEVNIDDRDRSTSASQGYASKLYRVISIEGAGACQALEFIATEDGQSASVIIPDNTLVFNGYPEFVSAEEIFGFINYDTNLSYEILITDPDGDDGRIPTFIIESLTKDECSATLIDLPVRTGETSVYGLLDITPLAPGECEVLITLEEDGVGGRPQSITINLPPPPSPHILVNLEAEPIFVRVGQDISFNVTVIHNNIFSAQSASFPRVVTSASGSDLVACEAVIADVASGTDPSTDMIEANYSINPYGVVGQALTASVRYTISSPTTAVNCGEFTFNATERGVTGEFVLTGVGFSPIPPPIVLINLAGEPLIVRVGQDINFNITAVKQDTDNTTLVSFPRVITSTNTSNLATCEAVIAGAASDTGPDMIEASYSVNSSGVIGLGSTASVRYTISSPTTAVNCGEFTFNATESGVTGELVLTGVGFSPIPPAIPPFVFSSVERLFISVGQDINFNITAFKQASDNVALVSFPRVVTSASGGNLVACEAFIAGAAPDTNPGTGTDMVEASYSINPSGMIGFGSTASVRYTISSPATAVNCGEFTFNATESGVTGVTSVSGIGFEDVSQPPPEPPAITSFPPIVLINPTEEPLIVRVGQDINFNITAVKQASDNTTLVSFPRVVTSASGGNLATCEAFIAGAAPGTDPGMDMVEASYSVNSSGVTSIESVASVRYTISSSPTPKYCGEFYFNATENAITGVSSVSGIGFAAPLPSSSLNIFVQSIYRSDTISIDSIENDNLRQVTSIDNESRQYQGLDVLFNNSPYRTSATGLFFIEVNATLTNPLGANEDMNVTFSESFSAGACSIVPVNITGREQDLSLAGGISGTLYKVTHTANGGSCAAITINATAGGVTTNVTIPPNILVFDEVPPAPPVVTSFSPVVLINPAGEPLVVRAGQDINFNITAVKQASDNTPLVSFPRVVTSASGENLVACEAFIADAALNTYTVEASYSANSSGVIGFGSTASVRYTISSPLTASTCGIFTFNATENINVGSRRVQDIGFYEDSQPPAGPPFVFSNVDGLFISVGQDINFNITAIKQASNNVTLVSFPRVVTSVSGGNLVACEAFIADAAPNTNPGTGTDIVEASYSVNSSGMIGRGSTASVRYTISSPLTAVNCGEFTFNATERGATGVTSVSGIGFEEGSQPPPEPPEPPEPSSFPPIVLINPTEEPLIVRVGQDINFNITAVKQDSDNVTLVSFPRVVTSASGGNLVACEAVIADAALNTYTVEASYSANSSGMIGRGSTASVRYTISSPLTAVNCGEFTFNATERGATGVTSVSGIGFEEASQPPPEPPEPPEPSSYPPIVLINPAEEPLIVRVGQDINFNITAVKQDSDNVTLVSFPRVVTSASGGNLVACDAFIADVALDTNPGTGTDIVKASYSANSSGVIGRGSTASVRYTISSPLTASTCGIFTFNATENTNVGSSQFYGIGFEEDFQPPPEPPEPPEPPITSSSPPIINSLLFTPSSLAANFTYEQQLYVTWDVTAADKNEFYPELSLRSITPDKCRFGLTRVDRFLRAHAATGSVELGSSLLVTEIRQPGICTIQMTATENNQNVIREVNLELPELAPSVFVQSLYISEDATATTPLDADEEFVLRYSDFTNAKSSPDYDFSDLIGDQGLTNLSAAAPYIVPANGVFFIGINATNSDPGDDEGDIDVTFSERIDGGINGGCVATLVDIAGTVPVTDYTSNAVSAIYKISHSDPINGGSCQGLMFNVTEDNQTGSVTIPANIFQFDDADSGGNSPGNSPPTAVVDMTASTTSSLATNVNAILVVNITKTNDNLDAALVVTAQVSGTPTNCAITLINTPTYNGDNIGASATAEFNIEFSGKLGEGGSCPVVVTIVEEGQAPLIFSRASTKFEFNALPQAFKLRTPTNIPVYDTEAQVIIDVIAIKQDNLIPPDGVRSINFNQPEMLLSSPANACMAMRFSGSNPPFLKTTVGSETAARYIFFLAPSFTGTSATCEWRVSATNPATPGADASAQTITIRFAD